MCLTMSRIQECTLLEILEERAEFEAQFARYRGLLRFISSRVLDAPEEIEEAVESCFLAASRNPQSFEYEGELRRWLVRIVLDEALEIRRRESFHWKGEVQWAMEYWRISLQDSDPV